MGQETITTVIARSASDEAIQGVIHGRGLLCCARNDGINYSVNPEIFSGMTA
jgi:hypothetical protein